MNNLRIGVWVSDLKLGVKAGLKAAAAMRPECIGLDAFEAEIEPRALSFSGRRELARHARSVAALVALKADLGGRGLADKSLLDVNLTRLNEAFGLAKDLGAPRLIINAGYVPEEKKENGTVRDALTEAAKALCAMANTSGVRVCWLAGSEPAAVLRDFLNSVDSSGMIEVDLNPGAFVMRGFDALDALNALSSRVAAARGVDHCRGGAEAAFGTGDVRWGEVLVGLSTLGREVDVLAGTASEGNRVEVVERAVKRLKELRTRPV